MTDGELAKIRQWLLTLVTASGKVARGSDKESFFNGAIMALGAVLALRDTAGPNGADMTDCLKSMEATMREIGGFGVKGILIPDLN